MYALLLRVKGYDLSSFHVLDWGWGGWTVLCQEAQGGWTVLCQEFRALQQMEPCGVVRSLG